MQTLRPCVFGRSWRGPRRCAPVTQLNVEAHITAKLCSKNAVQVRARLRAQLAKIDPLPVRKTIHSQSQYLLKATLRPPEPAASLQRLPPMDRSLKTFDTASTQQLPALNHTLGQSQSSFLPRRRGLALLTEQDEEPLPPELGPKPEGSAESALLQAPAARLRLRKAGQGFTSSLDYPKYLSSLQQNYDRFLEKTRSRVNLYVVPQGVYPDPHHLSEFYRVDMREYARNLRGYVL